MPGPERTRRPLDAPVILPVAPAVMPPLLGLVDGAGVEPPAALPVQYTVTDAVFSPAAAVMVTRRTESDVFTLVTVPSALVVSRIARFFHTTPNFLLGFDTEIGSEDAQRAGESDVYNALGLSQEAIDGLHRLRAQAVTEPRAAELLRLLDKLICSYTHETDKLL